MTLGEFKNHIESFPNGAIFPFGISEPFSWRGIYAEVAFSIVNQRMSKEEVLANIQMAYDYEFTGYKGGGYNYGDCTDIHFEEDSGSYTDGRYCSDVINEIEGGDKYRSQEERLVKIAFQ